MALVVETGAGLAAANSYASVATADTYHEDRANTAWADASDELKIAALIKATAYIDGKYYFRFTGTKASHAQALQWPRINALESGMYTISPDVLPPAVVLATCEAALLEIATEGALTPAPESGATVTRVKVGPVEEEYATTAPARTLFNVLDGLLRGIGDMGGGTTLRRG